MKKTTINKNLYVNTESPQLDQHKVDRDILLNARKKQLNDDKNSLDNNSFEWLTENSRNFLAAGYIDPTSTPEKRIREIADRAEQILGIDGYSDKFEIRYDNILGSSRFDINDFL